MSTLSLPSYAHAETPSYTRHPRTDEQTLGQTVPRRQHDQSSHEWSKRSGIATLTLTGLALHETGELPVYGRNTAIEGYVSLASVDGVASVRIKLEGVAKCKTIAEIGRTEQQIISTVAPLWHQGGSPCPTILPFKIPFPTTYTFGDETGPLPPTFEYTFYDVQGGTPGLRAKIKYSLRVEIEQSHLSLKDRLSSSLSVSLTYLPRSRPATPISSVPSTAFGAEMEHRLGSKARELDPIVWKLILPQPGTYALNQSIPFRVTVSSRSSPLITPFAPGRKDKASIRVYVLRQVTIKINRIDLWRSFEIAEGTLNYVPQRLDQGMWLKNVPSSPTKEKMASSESLLTMSEIEGWASHEWTGVLDINKEQAKVGGFTFGGMLVKDFIVLSVVPPNPRLGSLLEVKRVVPIQLTTDSWEGPGQVPIDPTTVDMNPRTNGYLEATGEPENGRDQLNGMSNGNGLHNDHASC